jgi:predicted unusual protein kinase regulating ubiquinone biosynthesis (AarF/ABC1/UbiB family)
MAAYYDGHPTICIPRIISELSTRRMVTSELSAGARFAELAS